LNFELSYDEETGYLKGKYESSDCRRVMGSVILYRSKMNFNQDKEPTATHLWKALLARDYKKGYPSPEIREIERNNFKFQPIFFDHDKSEIKPEFYDYLNKIARVLDGHSDLRVKVTGHTDAVGSDAYNIGLSERRAKAIVDYFLTQGIKEDKLEFDFKGKRMPAATNETPEGKQRNRRVDFEFI
jgi:outer membrane protein OmpA-like peptidoglycan-associated protein